MTTSINNMTESNQTQYEPAPSQHPLERLSERERAVRQAIADVPTAFTISMLEARLAALVVEHALKRVTLEELELAQDKLADARAKASLLMNLTDELNAIKQERIALTQDDQLHAARGIAAEHAQAYELYKANSQRLLDDFVELLRLEQHYINLTRLPAVPTHEWNTAHQRSLHLPAITAMGCTGTTGQWIQP